MPIIFGNAIKEKTPSLTSGGAAAAPSGPVRNNEVDNADANFYSTIRQTIQGLDRLIHDVIFTGSGFLLAFLSVAGVLFKTEAGVRVGGVDVGRHGAWIIALGALILAWVLRSRLKLYVDFLGEAVDIAKRIESALLEENLRLTHRFQKYQGSGIGGWSTLKFFAWGGVAVCATAFLFFFAAAWCPMLAQ